MKMDALKFYEVVLRVPSDPETELPGISDDFITWVSTRRWVLPEESDFEARHVCHAQLTLAERLYRVFCYEWRLKAKSDTRYFVQFEQGAENYHLHILVETVGVNSYIVGRVLNHIKKVMVRAVFRGVEPAVDEFMVCRKTRHGSANRVVDEDYIPAYLLPKRQPELQWAWSNIEKYIPALLSHSERDRLVREYLSLQPGQAGDGRRDPVVRGKVSERYMELVDWLVENGITSEKQWIQENRESYLSFNATGNSRSQIKAALDNAGKIMTLTKTAADYLIGSKVPDEITENRVYRIFELNGYDPAYAGSVLVGWCRREFGKRNTLWLFGPATTGKTNIAEAIALSVPFYGCVNWTNENFPFNDCVDKMVIWWEEGKMTNKVVESAKAILGGSRVRVDQKCKSSVQIDSTPVIITSNTDMCMVVDGNFTTFEHKEPLEDRMFRFHLTHRLPPTFGKIDKKEMREFMAWAEANRVEVQHQFHVARRSDYRPGNGHKRKAESDSEVTMGGGTDDAAEAISPVKRPRKSHSPAASEASGSGPAARPRDWTKRYECRCDDHVRADRVGEECPACEYLNRGKNGCLSHGVTNCPLCHAVPPWREEVVWRDDPRDLDDANKEQ